MINRSDVEAKKAYCEYLIKKGYSNVSITSNPCDIIGYIGNTKYFFEIKATTKKDVYFGASTFTEWECAFNNKDVFKFVVAIEEDDCFDFIEYTPDEFMEFSTIPPLKVFFNIHLKDNKKTNHKNAIEFNKDRFDKLLKVYKEL